MQPTLRQKWLKAARTCEQTAIYIGNMCEQLSTMNEIAQRLNTLADSTSRSHKESASISPEQVAEIKAIAKAMTSTSAKLGKNFTGLNSRHLNLALLLDKISKPVLNPDEDYAIRLRKLAANVLNTTPQETKPALRPHRTTRKSRAAAPKSPRKKTTPRGHAAVTHKTAAKTGNATCNQRLRAQKAKPR